MQAAFLAEKKFHLNKMWVQNVNVAILNFYWFSKTLLKDTVDMKIQKPSPKDLQSILIPSMPKVSQVPYSIQE